ncbi:hypothetical protein K4L44_05530 [Halosquirtibacter laminarini]|uniref:Uncharacterized protein n=1 Tax=Halosquirtibacter laminarini TaxID=3374600 RepID=A0AC61NHZ3_9BACT|nr:hypothetical protein K4L44_05530 [Prolixibacteraceae bacterium]
MSKLLIAIDLQEKVQISHLSYETSEKFAKDKVDIDSASYRIILDGVIVNRKDLIAQMPHLSWEEILCQMAREDGVLFHQKLRGSYYGFLFDKKRGEWTLFGDAINSKPLFYACCDGRLWMGNNIFDIASVMKKQGCVLTFDILSCYDMLMRGYLCEDHTLMSEVSRLRTGFHLTGEKDNYKASSYYKLSFEYDQTIKMNDAIEIVDTSFQKAVARNYSVDCDYGLKHVASLSGGLDSRLTVMMAHKMGFSEQLNFTFSQVGSLDQKVAYEISSDLQHEWIHQALDGGNFLKSVDDITPITQGLVLYFGFAHGYSMVKNLHLDGYGVMHTGLVGGEVIGSNLDSESENHAVDTSCKYHSRRLTHRQHEFDLNYYTNQEHFLLYTNDFEAYNLGSNVYHGQTESLSPFADIEFMEQMFQIPVSLRSNHKLYKEWIKVKHPEMAKYRWTTTGCRIDSIGSKHIRIGKFNPSLSRVVPAILERMGLRPDRWSDKHYMNPIQFYYNTNVSLQIWMKHYVETHIDLLDFDKRLKQDCLDLFHSGNCMEKSLSITLLSFIKAISTC